MSERYPGGLITKTPVTPAGPYETGAASGVWTLDQQLQYKQQGIWPIAGNVPPYIEDVFSTYLYTGTGASQTITNNIDTTTYGGLTWIKGRSGTTGHRLTDTARGVTKSLASNSTAAEATESTGLTAFGTTGFTIGADADYNTSAATYASWTFREQPKFFDVVTYSGNSVIGRAIPHSLGSAPGCVIVKSTDGAGENWAVWHRSGTQNGYFTAFLNSTSAYASAGGAYWQANSVAPDMNATTFSVGDNGGTNQTGLSYVAYVFAHDAGGFGLTGTDNVISCGSFTTDGSGNATVSLGYEPQWVMYKRSSGVEGWTIVDNMRGFTVTESQGLAPNSSSAEYSAGSATYPFKPTATGFQSVEAVSASSTYIYIAIRRGPMKVPTLGTSVYESTTYTGNNASERKIGSSVLTDLLLLSNRDATATDWSTYAQYVFDRLRGQNLSLSTSNTNAEVSGWNNYCNFDMNTGWDTGSTADQQYLNKTSSTYVSNAFRRAPSFFDEVCFSGTGTDDRQVTHNLGVAPELIICKSRSAAWPWWVGGSVLGSTRNGIYLNETGARQVNADAFSTNGAAFTSSYFLVSSVSAYPPNANTYTQVAYLFASCPGVSKVGSYTGTGATQTINCGFGASGSRFVLIKRTDSTGDWYVWDSARGMISGTDPSLLLNSTAAEVNANSVYAISTGFQIVSTAAGINASAGTYIFLAIA